MSQFVFNKGGIRFTFGVDESKKYFVEVKSDEGIVLSIRSGKILSSSTQFGIDTFGSLLKINGDGHIDLDKEKIWAIAESLGFSQGIKRVIWNSFNGGSRDQVCSRRRKR